MNKVREMGLLDVTDIARGFGMVIISTMRFVVCTFISIQFLKYRSLRCRTGFLFKLFLRSLVHIFGNNCANLKLTLLLRRN